MCHSFNFQGDIYARYDEVDKETSTQTDRQVGHLLEDQLKSSKKGMSGCKIGKMKFSQYEVRDTKDRQVGIKAYTQVHCSVL